MSRKLELEEQRVAELSAALIDIVPKVFRRLRADVPLLHSDMLHNDPELQEVADLRATTDQLNLLRTLVEHERCMMQELAERLAVAPSTVTAMIKRLLAQGYVERGHDDVDWRTVWIKLTPLGHRVVTAYDHARCASLQQRLTRLSAEEQAQLQNALPALRRLIEM